MASSRTYKLASGYLGQCKARPFNFHQVCLFVSFFVSLFQCPNTVYPNTEYLEAVQCILLAKTCDDDDDCKGNHLCSSSSFLHWPTFACKCLSYIFLTFTNFFFHFTGHFVHATSLETHLQGISNVFHTCPTCRS